MLRISRQITIVLAIALSMTSLVACGKSGTDENAVVAHVGTTPITVGTLLHWTATFVRGDYYQVTKRRAPRGLATDPPDYSACVSAAKTIKASSAGAGTELTATQLDDKCHQLYQTVKHEALSYLISVVWSAGDAAERGQKITEADISERIAQLQHEEYPKKGQFEAYLINKGWSRADLRYIVKRNLLVGETVRLLETKANEARDGKTTFARLMTDNARKWTARTSCAAGYVVEQCREYKGSSGTDTSAATSPAVIFEQMSGSS